LFGGLKYGVDFAGGILIQIKFSKPVDISKSEMPWMPWVRKKPWFRPLEERMNFSSEWKRLLKIWRPVEKDPGFPPGAIQR